MTAHEATTVVTRIWKDEAAKIVAALVRLTGDVGRAEELAQDALVAALEQWPSRGVPDRPGAWLMATAKNRALNALNHARMADGKHAALARDADVPADAVEEAAVDSLDDELGDDVLKLLFTACHPVVGREARVALTLRLVAGLSTDEIARAFLVPEPTIAQRIVRAKRAIADAAVPFEIPRGDQLGPRLGSVLEVVYLVFNEGYSASSGDALIRHDLIAEALRLGEILARLAPGEPEVVGLLALMELQASRAAARVDASGDPVLLADQDRSRWDGELVRRGLARLAAAESLGGTAGVYRLQARIAACHARAPTADATDWRAIADAYVELMGALPSPVVALNRAMAVSRADGPAAGLALLDALEGERALKRYHLLPAARADLLERLGRHAEAAEAFELAASLAENVRQRERLGARAAAARRRAEGRRS